MVASKTGRARKARRKSAKKTGLFALAAPALASPVATTPVIAQSPSSVSPQPSPPSSTDTKIDEAMGTMGADIPLASPGAKAIGPTGSKPGGALQPTSKRDKLQTGVLQPTLKRDKLQTGVLQPTLRRDKLQTGVLQTAPATPSTKDKALIFTGPSKPSR